MNLEKALKTTGFVKCEFVSDSDPCDKCREPWLQMYYRRTCYEVNEGDYYCESCVINEADDIESVIEITCECGDKFLGWPHQHGDSCMDCVISMEENQ